MLHSSIPRFPFTQEAFEQMKADVVRLETEREAVMGRIKIAREMGDLSENGAYKYGKFELGNIRRELGRLTRLIERAKVVKYSGSGIVEFGARVTISDGQQESTYLIVGPHESDPSKGKLSMESPLGVALLGKRTGDTAVFTVPAGTKIYSILAIQ